MSLNPSGFPRLVGTLSVNTEVGAFLGDTRIRLLEAIGRHGSISRAAKAVPMSYKAAWDALDAMNNLADSPLVESAVGGRHGGGTHLTDFGHRLITLYRAVEEESVLNAWQDGPPCKRKTSEDLNPAAFKISLDV